VARGIKEDVLATLRSLPDESEILLIVSPPEDEMQTRKQRLSILAEATRVCAVDGDVVADTRLLRDLDGDPDDETEVDPDEGVIIEGAELHYREAPVADEDVPYLPVVIGSMRAVEG
jgi:hypothetical protein